MPDLLELWLPILLSAVFVFVVSSVLHMAVPIHKSDHRGLPDEDAVLDALRQHGVGPGAYAFPYCDSMKAMGSEEMKAKYARGPVGWLRVLPGMPSIGVALGQWFLYSILISWFVAYIGSVTLPYGADYLLVFRALGTAAILGYAFGTISEMIWKGQSVSVTAKFVFDGLLYGLTTAGTFAWLWPAAA